MINGKNEFLGASAPFCVPLEKFRASFFSDVSMGIDAVLHGLSNDGINFVGNFYLDTLMVKILKKNDYFHEPSLTMVKLDESEISDKIYSFQ